MIRIFSLLFFLFTSLVVGAAECGEEPNSLDGSVTVSLEFDRTRMLRGKEPTHTIQLEYIKDLDAGEDVVAKIVFDTPDGGFDPDVEYDLKKNNAIVERVTKEKDNFGELTEGIIVFFEGGNANGKKAVGRFAATFENGRTLRGNFDVKVEGTDFF